jgi:hypothetical protein
MEFNIEKCKVLHIGHSNYHSANVINDTNLGTVHLEMDLGVLISDDLQQDLYCLHAYNKASKYMVLIKCTFHIRYCNILMTS